MGDMSTACPKSLLEAQCAGTPDSWSVERRCVLAASSSAMVLVTVGCGSKNTGEASLDIKQLSTLRELCDFLIPRTDTPGAVDAGCVDFVAKSIVSSAADERQRLLSAIDHFGNLLKSTRGWRGLAEAAAREGEDVAAALKKIRGWILLGYYTSEPGATKELRYELVPGRFDPDVPVTADTRSYSSDWLGVALGGR